MSRQDFLGSPIKAVEQTAGDSFALPLFSEAEECESKASTLEEWLLQSPKALKNTLKSCPERAEIRKPAR
jgi:hypothetical protein